MISRERPAPADLVDPRVTVGAIAAVAVPAAAAHARFGRPTSCAQGGTRLVDTRVCDDFSPALAGSLSGAPAVKHRRGVPAQCGRGVAPDAEAIDLDDAPAVQSAGNRVARDRKTKECAAVPDRGAEPPSYRRPVAMGVVACDESAGVGAVERTDLQGPVEQEAASTVIGDPAQFEAGKAFDLEMAHEVPCPRRILGHVGSNLLMQTFATGFEHELMAPDFKDRYTLGLTTEQARWRSWRCLALRGGHIFLGDARASASPGEVIRHAVLRGSRGMSVWSAWAEQHDASSGAKWLEQAGMKHGGEDGGRHAGQARSGDDVLVTPGDRRVGR